MSSYGYIAVDPRGGETRGTLEVADQNEAVRRIKEMGLFPTRILEEPAKIVRSRRPMSSLAARETNRSVLDMGFGAKITPGQLAVLTRQLATLIEAGMPLLRSLRILGEQAETRALTEAGPH